MQYLFTQMRTFLILGFILGLGTFAQAKPKPQTGPSSELVKPSFSTVTWGKCCEKARDCLGTGGTCLKAPAGSACPNRACKITNKTDAALKKKALADSHTSAKTSSIVKPNASVTWGKCCEKAKDCLGTGGTCLKAPAGSACPNKACKIKTAAQSKTDFAPKTSK